MSEAQYAGCEGDGCRARAGPTNTAIVDARIDKRFAHMEAMLREARDE